MEPSGIEPQRLRAAAREVAEATGLSGSARSADVAPGWTLAVAGALVAALGLPEVREALADVLRRTLSDLIFQGAPSTPGRERGTAEPRSDTRAACDGARVLEPATPAREREGRNEPH